MSTATIAPDRRPARDPDLVACAALLALAVLAVLLGVGGVVGAVLGTAAVLLVPGYALVAAAFGPRLPEWATRGVLAFALSVASGALGSVLLHALGIALSTTGLVIWTLLVGLGALAVAARRRRGHAAPVGLPAFPARTILVNGLIALALAGAVAVLIGAARDVRPVRDIPAGRIGLWAVPQGADRLAVGLVARNGGGGDYRLEIRQTVTGQPPRVTSVPVRLPAGGTWRTVIPRVVGARTEMLLFRAGNPAVLRRIVVPAPSP